MTGPTSLLLSSSTTITRSITASLLRYPSLPPLITTPCLHRSIFPFNHFLLPCFINSPPSLHHLLQHSSSLLLFPSLPYPLSITPSLPLPSLLPPPLISPSFLYHFLLLYHVFLPPPLITPSSLPPSSCCHSSITGTKVGTGDWGLRPRGRRCGQRPLCVYTQT